jgi:hypothetical protein
LLPGSFLGKKEPADFGSGMVNSNEYFIFNDAIDFSSHFKYHQLLKNDKQYIKR